MAYPRTYNAATEMVDAHIPAGRGDKAAFIDSTETLSYAGLADPKKRADIIEYLRTDADNPQPKPAPTEAETQAAAKPATP